MRRGLILMLAAATLAVGCGGGDGRGDVPRGADAIAAPSVALRAELAGALGSRPWLTALAVRTALVDGPSAPTTQSARIALADATALVGRRLETALGQRPGARATTLLRAEDRRLADLARTRASSDPAARRTVRAGLSTDRRALTALLTAADRLPRSVALQLGAASRSLATAAEAAAGGTPGASALTAAAAADASRPALALARNTARRRPELAGSASSPAAELAAFAATALTDAAYAQAATCALAGARGSRRLRAARRTLDQTTEAVGQLVASVYGEDAGERFTALWGDHAAAFTDYARAKGDDDAAAARRALGALDGFRTQTATLLAELDPERAPRTLAAALDAHVSTTTAVVRAQSTDSPKLAPRLLEAADAARALGRTLATGAARQFPGRFPAG